MLRTCMGQEMGDTVVVYRGRWAFGCARCLKLKGHHDMNMCLGCLFCLESSNGWRGLVPRPRADVVWSPRRSGVHLPSCPPACFFPGHLTFSIITTFILPSFSLTFDVAEPTSPSPSLVLCGPLRPNSLCTRTHVLRTTARYFSSPHLFLPAA